MEKIAIPYGSTHLNGVLHKPEKQNAQYTIIVSHGFRGSKDGGGRAVDMAQALSEHFNVIRYDFLPLSTITEQSRQLMAVIEYTNENIGRDIVLYGRSMGADASLVTAAEYHSIKGLIFWSMPFDLLETFSLSLGMKNLEQLKNGVPLQLDDEWGKAELAPAFYTDLVKYDPVLALNNIPSIPILFVHGENDEIVPLHQAEAAFAAAKEPKTLKIVSGGDHRFLYTAKEAQHAVMYWLKENFLKKDV